MAISPYCIPCEKNNCWIEIDVRDEQNRSFKGQKATLTDASGTSKTVTLKDGPTLVQGFAVGPVTVKLETQPWLKAAQSREALKKGEASQVPAYTEKFWGHCGVKREHVKVTTGDLCLTDPEQPLPEGHKAGQAQPSQEGHKAGQAQPQRFITKHSYVIEVKGYQLTTLRIGVFFDGTSNNTFNHEKGKNALEAALAKCSPQEQVALLEQCFEGTLPGGLNNSEKNDVTNIGKASDLYLLSDKALLLSIPVYVEGIGTAKGQDDTKAGAGADKGETSSTSRVEQACRTQIVAKIKEQLSEILPSIECIHKVEFDVFGFSRGASAARQFVNRIDQKGDHPLVEAMTTAPDIPLKAGFDWSSRDDVRIQFVGLFDTVVSSYLWGKRSVTLAPDCAERVVHIIAADEWRYHFDLTRIKNMASDLPASFTEVIIPGAHSDIGGGYYSRWSLRDPNYASPVINETKVIATFKSTESRYSTAKDSHAYSQATAYAKMRAAQGWAKGVELISSYNNTTVSGYLNVRPQRLGTVSKDASEQEVKVDVVLHRVVEGEYSRIPLHMMVEAARDAGVPFDIWDPTDNSLRMDSALSYPTLNLAALDTRWVDAAKRRGEVIDLTRTLSPQEYQALRLGYLHYSADTGMVNKPNRVGDQEVRQVTDNQKGGY
ncbi:TPA: T6SS phospholipase effector Tle1-like catalytic domain-containing protein [Aeromonas hydrophila]